MAKAKAEPTIDVEAWAEETSADAARHGLALAKAKRTSSEWRRMALALQRELDLATERFDALAAIKLPVEQPFRVTPLSSRRKSRNAAIAGLVASDWHVGERVDPGQVSGLNEFNPSICETRVAKCFERTLRMVEIQRGGADVRECVLALLGDFMGGYIHEDLQLTNHLSPTEEVRFAKRLLIGGIDYLLERGKFERIWLPCSYGNHGRINRGKPLIGAAPRNSYEVMLYADLADHYARDRRLTFLHPAGPFTRLDLGGFVVRATHGDTFRYGGGIGGLTVPLLKALHRWESHGHADLTIFGHWHQWHPGPRWIGNGSIKGFDAFAAHVGCEYEPPSQAFFLIDVERRRRTLAEPIFLD